MKLSKVNDLLLFVLRLIVLIWHNAVRLDFLHLRNVLSDVVIVGQEFSILSTQVRKRTHKLKVVGPL